MRTIPFLMSEMSFEEPSFNIFTLNISLVYEELLTFKIGALTCGVTIMSSYSYRGSLERLVMKV